ncbi:MAG: glycosyltransferase [Nostocoides sp.]
MTRPVLDVVIPVYNEQAILTVSVERLHEHLLATFPYPFRITIADNASTDVTWLVAGTVTDRLAAVRRVHLDQKGRGRALKQVWLASDAYVLAYMDVDLSTDLDALWPLVAPLMSGHSDLAIGSRLSRSSRVVRGAKREVISRSYNLILKGALGAHFSDAQCGFKAIRADVAQELLPLVEDPTWFFDTELLVLAERCRLRIHEVPVDWWDDPDSRVNIVQTATDDLRGVLRMRRAFARGILPVPDLTRRLGRRMPEGHRTVSQLAVFLVIGAVSMGLQLAFFAGLRTAGMGAQWANVTALIGSTLFNTAANRRWTFGVRGRANAGRHQLAGLALLAMTLGITAGALDLLKVSWPGAPTWIETGVVGLSTALATGLKFVIMRRWVFIGNDTNDPDGAGAPRPVSARAASG